MRPLNRPDPVAPVQAYRTYQIVAPQETHWRPATCAEVDCPNWRNGFKVPVPAGEEGDKRAHLIKTSGKPYRVEPGEDGIRWAVFPEGTACFSEPTHRVQYRPERYIVRPGDWRGNPGGRGAVREHTRPADWVEDVALHTAKVFDELRKG